MAVQHANLRKTSGFMAVCALAFTGAIMTTPAAAEFDLGAFFRHLFGVGHRHHFCCRSHHVHHHYDDGDDNESAASPSPSPDESTRELAELAPPSTHDQMAVLKNVNASGSLGAVGSSEDQDASVTTAGDDADRDYIAMVDRLMQVLKQRRGDSDHQGDVTETAVMDALTEAILRAKLERFETFVGENWSAERLRGMIVKRVTDEIGGLSAGNNRGAVTMADLDMMIKKAAREVYARLFETSELLASNHSATLFLQRLYQAHGGLAKGDVRADTEALLQKASADGLSHFEDQFSRAERPYTLIYRAQRILFDCLSDNVESITASGVGNVTAAEFEKRLLDTDAAKCRGWIANQMVGADGNLKPQNPLPLRVIWTSVGPKDDPTMYGRASDQS